MQVAPATVIEGEGEVNTFRETKDFHVKSFVLMLLVWASFITAGVYLALHYFMGFEYHIWIAFPVVYFVYIAEALIFTCDCCVKCGCSSATCAYLRNVKSDAGTERFIAGLQSAAPQFQMYVECYHYETRTRTVSSTDSNGNTTYRTETYTERVVTHTASDYIEYGAWKDCSTTVRGLGEFRVIKIDLEKDYEYHDEETYQSFAYQRLSFRRHNDRDVHQDYTEHFIVPGFCPFALCCRHGDRPKALHLCYYVLCSLFMLSHPYRVWMENLSVKTDVNIRKRVSADPMAMQELPLVMQYQQNVDITLQTAVVYQELYGVQQPNLPVAVAQAVPVATAVPVIPMAYAVPVVATENQESSKEDREQMFAQLETLPQPAHLVCKEAGAIKETAL